jgi:hypothetical protein
LGPDLSVSAVWVCKMSKYKGDIYLSGMNKCILGINNNLKLHKNGDTTVSIMTFVIITFGVIAFSLMILG